MTLKEKLVFQWLPMWAKETVFYENRSLRRRVAVLEQENKELRSFITGMISGLKARVKPSKEVDNG